MEKPKLIDVSSVPEQFAALREAIADQNDRIESQPPGEDFMPDDAWYNGRKNFAAQYKVDIYNMAPEDMKLIKGRLEYWGG